MLGLSYEDSMKADLGLSLSKVVSTISFAIVGYSPILFIPVRSYLLKGIKTNTTALSRLMKGYQLIDYIDLTHQSHSVKIMIIRG